ncbi:CGNR zinc finger domain-containing protein [Micromonospora sp. NPDC003816]|uniref:CGNR zinc finger domain-containing protein n=1 Tax=Micromonospora sp. NPDC003816 TaxID=3364224 RepID=UPI00367C6F87
MPDSAPIRAQPVGVRAAPATVGPPRPSRARGAGTGNRSGLADSYRLALRAAALANARLDDLTDARTLLAQHPPLPAVVDADLQRLQEVGHRLRQVFQSVTAGGEQQAADEINALLTRYRVRPMISGTSAVDWHMHVATPGTPRSVEYVAAAVWGLAVWLCERGIDRLGVCADPECPTAFLDDSRNRCRRFCSDRCATRHHVRAHRARRRATRP